MNNPEKQLTGRVALVTGGTKGIGKAIADELANMGATVVITARNEPTERSAYEFIAADLTNTSDNERLAKTITERYEAVDILINNVGGTSSPAGGFNALSEDDWENDLQVNLLAAIKVDKALLPKMIERKKGVILHISLIQIM